MYLSLFNGVTDALAVIAKQSSLTDIIRIRF